MKRKMSLLHYNLIYNIMFFVVDFFSELKYRVDQKYFYISIGSCIEQRWQGGAGGLRNARAANRNLVPWHHSVGDNLCSAYVSTTSITKMLLSLQHTA